ncbi:MAG TPA: Gfo/Idh/MocA family oxidoreductase [Actinospica sp.]|nr:Gfo/Idh/MocA family oxidoreductase [Actinospica sp.]
MTMEKVRWGVLASATYADVAVLANAQSATTEFVAIANADGGESSRHTEGYGLAKNYDTYEELLASDDIDAVFIALTPNLHAEWAVKALQAGKHVLVEKPLALTAADANRVFDAAEAAGKIAAEALLYQFHPRTQLLRDLVAEGRIGKLQYIYSGCTATVPPTFYRRDKAIGGGAMLDLGVFPLSAVLLFAGAPERVYAEQALGAGGEDVSFAATLRLADGVLAQFEAGQEVARGDDLQIVGTLGRLIVKDPWFHRPENVELSLQGPPPHGEPQSELIPVDPDGKLGIGLPYAVARYPFDAFSTAVATGGSLPFGRTDAVNRARVVEALFESAEHGRAVALTCES